jgi:hypothetical protein
MNGKLDLLKGGQGLMQTPPDFNLEWIAWSRVMNYRMKEWANDCYFIDDREPVEDFRERLSRAIREMPSSAQFAVVDAKEFDSQQNEVTVYAEYLFMCKLGFPENEVYDFQKWRREAKFICPRLFTGAINGDKGSGFLDTKSGNTVLETICSQALTTGVGPKIEAAKGDDDLVVQCGLKENLEGRKNLLLYMGMQQTVDIGDGAEFIGTTVSRNGMYANPVRTAIKATAHHYKDKTHFLEIQKAYRNHLKTWRIAGLQETIAATAEVTNSSVNYVKLCVGFVDSMSHITWEQFNQIAKPVKDLKFSLPSSGFGLNVRV